jgi:hypothetical protein
MTLLMPAVLSMFTFALVESEKERPSERERSESKGERERGREGGGAGERERASERASERDRARTQRDTHRKYPTLRYTGIYCNTRTHTCLLRVCTLIPPHIQEGVSSRQNSRHEQLGTSLTTRG